MAIGIGCHVMAMTNSWLALVGVGWQWLVLVGNGWQWMPTTVGISRVTFRSIYSPVALLGNTDAFYPKKALLHKNRQGGGEKQWDNEWNENTKTAKTL